jgi:DNA mismatch repair protein MutS2
LRETSTYFLCELLLDDAALAALAALDSANECVAEIEERVRATLSAAVAAHANALDRAAEMLGALDLLLARVSFAQRYACVVPEIESDAGVAFTDARYLPLASTLERYGRRYAPISLELAGIGVVTGPNMGGKSASLRTVGFLAACVALGVPVPAREARIALFDAIAWLGIGSAQSDEGLLSAFGSEVVAVRAFLNGSARRSLVLIDEFARTTSPLEGRALLVALLETLHERGSIALAATHLANVVPSAGAAHFSIGGLADLAARGPAPLDLETALARIASAMDYRLRRVSEDAIPVSDAIALAEALGLEPEFIVRAKAHL